MVTTTSTQGKIFIGNNEIGEVMDFTCTDFNIPHVGNSWMLDIPKSCTGTFKVILKNKIEKALGFTHYVKKGKLFIK